MKRFLLALQILAIAGVSYAGQGISNTLTVSSGTFKPIQGSGNNSGNFVQWTAIADSSYTVTAPVDPVGGLTVTLGTSTAAGIGSLSAGTAEIGNVKNSGTFATQAAQSGTWTVQPGNTANTTAWKVDGSAVTQPISGAVSQSGTWTVQPGNTANTTAWKVDGSAVTQPVSGTVSAQQSGRFAVDVSSLNATLIDTNSGNKSGGTQRIVIATDQPALTNALKVDGSAVTQPVSGTVTAIQGTNASLHASVAIDGSSNTVKAQGDVAGGSSDSGNPVKIGGIGHTTYQTAVTDTQRVDAAFDSEGKQVVMPYAIPALSTSGVTAAMTGTAQTILISSGGANINTYISGIYCFNSHATVGTVINIRNGQTLRYTGYAVSAGGGFVAPFPTPLPGASNSQWTAENATTGSNIYCNATGYFAKN